jgi:hypothetical protein
MGVGEQNAERRILLRCSPTPNNCSCLNLILACIVYWQACEIFLVRSECDPVANGIDLSLLEHVSPIEWDNVVLYGQYILDRKLVRRRRRAKRVVLSV